jgi:hypothetical protein
MWMGNGSSATRWSKRVSLVPPERSTEALRSFSRYTPSLCKAVWGTGTNLSVTLSLSLGGRCHDPGHDHRNGGRTDQWSSNESEADAVRMPYPHPFWPIMGDPASGDPAPGPGSTGPRDDHTRRTRPRWTRLRVQAARVQRESIV